MRRLITDEANTGTEKSFLVKEKRAQTSCSRASDASSAAAVFESTVFEFDDLAQWSIAVMNN